MEKTDAASVELMTEPIKKLSKGPKRRTKWQNRAVSPAVSTTPRVDRQIALAATGRAAFQLVPKPP